MTQETTPRLARGPHGEAIATSDDQGELRYMYAGGAIDTKSTVNTSNPIIKVGNLVVEGIVDLAPSSVPDEQPNF